MATRDEVFYYFGPIQIEALLLILLKQVNILRKEQGFPEWTFQEAIDELNNDQTHLAPYDWMR